MMELGIPDNTTFLRMFKIVKNYRIYGQRLIDVGIMKALTSKAMGNALLYSRIYGNLSV
jgi:hypothetical protein